MKILTQDDLLHILPFGKTKLNMLLISGSLPVVKIGRDYITTDEQIMEWIRDNTGKEIKY